MEARSAYVEKLDKAAKERYQEKVGLISNIDPFLLGCGALAVSVDFPPVDASDLVSYLVLQTSFITAQQYKAHKSLEAYNQFVCGWVKDVRAWSLNGRVVLTGRVRHSQRSNDTPLSCWIICEVNGEICCAHCNCMAGLGEVCTHVAATLFFVEAFNRMNNKIICTQQKCQWVVPSYQKSIPYEPVKNIDFTSAKAKKFKIALQNDKNFCLESSDPTAVQLNRSHAYYYQVQTQLFVCDVPYCDFVVCTFPTTQVNPDVYIERIYPDEELWSTCVRKSSAFFHHSILPEVVGRFFTRPMLNDDSSSSSTTSKPSSVSTSDGQDDAPHSEPAAKLYCCCQKPEGDDLMIACDNQRCSIEWYHVKCLNMSSIPEGEWYCPDCKMASK